MKTSMSLLFFLSLCLTQGLAAASAKLDQIRLPDAVFASNCETLKPRTSEALIDSFLYHICRYHYLDSSGSADDLNELVSDLQSLQNYPLDWNRKNLAILYEGLTSCKLASTLRTDLSPLSSSADGEQKALYSHQMQSYCQAGSQAQLAFSDVNWSRMNFTRTGAADFLEERLTELSACYENVLNDPLLNQCDRQGIESSTDVKAVVDTAVDAAISEYLDGEAAPMSVLFSARIDEANGVLTNFQQRIPNLTNRLEQINTNVGNWQGLYTEVKGYANDMIKRYQAVAVNMTLLREEIEKLSTNLSTNLLVDSTGKNWGVTLDDQKREAASSMTSVSDTLANFQTLNTQLQGVIASDQQLPGALLDACKIYYCSFFRAGTELRPGSSCSYLQDNPLCPEFDPITSVPSGDGSNIKVGAGNGKKVTAICQDAGLNATYTKFKLGKKDVVACNKVCLGGACK